LSGTCKKAPLWPWYNWAIYRRMANYSCTSCLLTTRDLNLMKSLV